MCTFIMGDVGVFLTLGHSSLIGVCGLASSTWTLTCLNRPVLRADILGTFCEFPGTYTVFAWSGLFPFRVRVFYSISGWAAVQACVSMCTLLGVPTAKEMVDCTRFDSHHRVSSAALFD